MEQLRMKLVHTGTMTVFQNWPTQRTPLHRVAASAQQAASTCRVTCVRALFNLAVAVHERPRCQLAGKDCI